MQIKSITLATLQIPLIRPFITAVRQTSCVDDVIVMINTDNGMVGYGSAAATPAITGETQESIISAIKDIIAPRLINQNILEFNKLINLVQTALPKNTSAKASIDIALHDLFAKVCKLPLYRLLGGGCNQLETCITISAKATPEMVADAQEFVRQGFTTLKLKVGLNSADDIQRITAIRKAIDNKIKILLDANQGWDSKTAINIIHQIEKNNLNIELIEQPVKANDLSGFKSVRDKVNIDIIADESCFTQYDTLNIVNQKISDGVNIKLMKCGGIYNANIIHNIATTAGLKCMAGCMLESPIGVTAIASFASSKTNIFFNDFDPIALIKTNPIIGGAKLINNKIVLSDDYGLGITGFNEKLSIISEVK